jgi:HK97 family phage portal protein
MIYTTTHLAGVFNLAEGTSGSVNPADWFVRAIGGGESDSGVDVNSSTMLTSGPIWEAINIISDDVAMLPLHVYRRIGEDVKEKDRRHNAYKLLQREPHPEVTPLDFTKRLIADALSWGNGVAFMTRFGPKVKFMSLCEPSRTWLARNEKTRVLEYRTVDDFGAEWTARRDDVFHIKGFGTGTWGYNVFENARHSWGMHLALTKHGNRQFARGSIPSGVITSEYKMGPEGRAGVRREWNDVHQGVENTGEVAVLTKGLTYQAITIPNREAEWLGSLDWSVKDVAAWFKLPPHKLGYLKDSAVRANLEEQNREYLQQCLAPWLKRVEHEAERKLLAAEQWKNNTHFIRYNTGGLLKGDFRSTMEAIQIGRQAEVLSINDGRRIIDENPIGPDGDEYRNPATRSNDNSNDNGRMDGEDDDDSRADNNTSSKADGAKNESSGREVSAVVQLASESLQKIHAIERRRLVRAAKEHPDKFEELATKFYQRAHDVFADTFSTVVRAGQTLGVTPEIVSSDVLARNWAVESYDRITVALNGSTVTANAVESELQTWASRHDTVMSVLLGKDGT